MPGQDDVLVLTDRDIARVIDVPGALSIVEQAFRLYSLSQVEMPPKVYLSIDQHGDYRAMPARIGRDAAGLKWVSVYPENPARHLPTVMATIILNDIHTGRPIALMGGTYITKVRTAAAGGVAARYLARPNSTCIGLVGCGAQAEGQLQALMACFLVEQVLVWGPHKPELRAFVQRQRRQGTTRILAEKLETVVREADILVTTTPSRRPLIRRRWVREGTHINAIGADAKGKQELDPTILLDAKVIVDDWEQASHSGEINVAVSCGLIGRRHITASLGEIVARLKPVQRRSTDITVFDSTGLAVQDIAVAAEVYARCRRRRIGRRIRFLAA